MTYTQVTISTVFTCANCGGQFIHSHVCPTMPWGTTSPPPVYIVPTFIPWGIAPKDDVGFGGLPYKDQAS